MQPEEKNNRKLWIFDFDGTLSNLVPERSAAQILAEAKDLLKALLHLPGHQVAVLSSLLLKDLIPRVGIPGLCLGGGSGAEGLMPNGRRPGARSVKEPVALVKEVRKLAGLKSF